MIPPIYHDNTAQCLTQFVQVILNRGYKPLKIKCKKGSVEYKYIKQRKRNEQETNKN